MPEGWPARRGRRVGRTATTCSSTSGWPTNLTYAQIIDQETSQALMRLATGSEYTNTFHIANLMDYDGAGDTLMFDWASSLIAKYSSYYSVPLLSPGWPGIAQDAKARNAHFAALAAGVDAVYDETTNTVTVNSPSAATLSLTGALTAGATTYGSDLSGSVTLNANVPVSFPAKLLP